MDYLLIKCITIRIIKYGMINSADKSIEIQMGEVTNHQDQSITWHNFSTRKTMNKVEIPPPPIVIVLLLDIILFVFFI